MKVLFLHYINLEKSWLNSGLVRWPRLYIFIATAHLFMYLAVLKIAAHTYSHSSLWHLMDTYDLGKSHFCEQMHFFFLLENISKSISNAVQTKAVRIIQIQYKLQSDYSFTLSWHLLVPLLRFLWCMNRWETQAHYNASMIAAVVVIVKF